MKTLKTKKAGIGGLITKMINSPEFKNVFSQLNVTGGNPSTWSKEKMAGLSSYAPGSYGTGQKVAKAKTGAFISKGKDYIKDLL